MTSFFQSFTLNGLDILILLPLCWFGYIGFKNGLIRELVSVAALILGVWVTVKFSDVVASWFGDSRMIKIMAFILTFILVLVLVRLVGMLVESVVKIVLPGFINHLFGMLFGIGKVAIIVSVLFYVIRLADPKEVILKKEVKEESFLYSYVTPLFPKCKQIIFD